MSTVIPGRCKYDDTDDNCANCENRAVCLSSDLYREEEEDRDKYRL